MNTMTLQLQTNLEFQFACLGLEKHTQKGKKSHNLETVSLKFNLLYHQNISKIKKNANKCQSITDSQKTFLMQGEPAVEKATQTPKMFVGKCSISIVSTFIARKHIHAFLAHKVVTEIHSHAKYARNSCSQVIIAQIAIRASEKRSAWYSPLPVGLALSSSYYHGPLQLQPYYLPQGKK